MKYIIFSLFLISVMKKVFSQKYNTINNVEINNVKIRLTKESDLQKLLGSADSVKQEIDYAGDGEYLKKYYYKNSYFVCWDGVLQTFLIKDVEYIFNGKFKKGDSINVFENHFPTSHANPLLNIDISDFDKQNFTFDKYYWIDVGGEDGLLVFSNNNIIVGFRYSFAM